MMNDYNNYDGNGCLSLPGLALAVMLLLFLLTLAGGDDTATNTANVEALSRNQVNLWSDVTNEYYTCLGAGSCVTSVETSTSTTNAPVNVDGDRNVIYSSSGVMLCPNPDNPNEWGDVPAWCEAAGVQP